MTIKVGMIVQASGEPFTRSVVLVQGDRAKCKRHGREEYEWFNLTDLREDRPSGPLRINF